MSFNQDLSFDIIGRDRFSRTYDQLTRSNRQAETQINSLNRSLEQQSRTAQRSAAASKLGRNTASFGPNIAGVIGGVAIGGFAVAQIGRQVVQLAEYSTTVERTSTAFEFLSGSAANAAAKLSAIDRASGGAIDKLSAMGIANRAAALGMAETAGELERVTRFATIAGRVLGVDTATALDNLALAASNLSFARLDQMGVSASAVRSRFQELRGELGDSKAFLEATLEAGEQTFGGLANSAIAAASGIEIFKKEVADLNLEFTQQGSVIDQVIGGYGQLLRNTRITREAQKFLKEEFASTDPVIQAHIEQIGFLDAELAAGQIHWQEYVSGVELAMNTLGAYTLQVQAALDATRALNGEPVLGQTPWSEAFKLFGDPRGFISQQIADKAAAVRSNQSLQQLLSDANQKTLTNDIKGLYRDLNRDTSKDVSRIWQSAVDKMQSTFTSALRSVPGLFGNSQVTQRQFDLGAAGISQNFADDFRRRANDLLINGVQRSGITRDFIESLVSASENIPKDQLRGLSGNLLSSLLDEAFGSQRVFGTEIGQANIDKLLNFDAIENSLALQGRGAAGQNFLEQALKGRGLEGAFAGAGGFAGLGDEFSRQIADSNLGSQFGTALQQQLASPSSLEAIALSVPSLWSSIENSLLNTATESNIGFRIVSLLLSLTNEAASEVSP